MNRIAACCLSLLLSLPLPAGAQSNTVDYGKNAVKLNLVGLFARNLGLQYERGLGRHTSVALGVRVEPRGKVPLKGLLESKYGGNYNVDNFLSDSRLSNIALTPEFRYYLGKRPQNGIYFAPYARYAHFKITWPFSFTDNDGRVRPINFTGNADYLAAGLMAGGQWHFGHHFLVDVWVAGLSLGQMKTDLNAAVDISDMDWDDKLEMKLIIEGTAINGSRLTVDVSDNGVRAKGAFRVPGVRTGLCVGFVF